MPRCSHFQHILDMNEADDVIFVLVAYRITGMHFLERDRLFSSNDRLAYRQIISVRGIMISLAWVSAKSKILSISVNSVLSINPDLWLSFIKNPDFFFRMGGIMLGRRFYPECLQQPVGHAVKKPMNGYITLRNTISGIAVHIVRLPPCGSRIVLGASSPSTI